MLASRSRVACAAFALLGGALFSFNTALARDSSRQVCSGIAELRDEGPTLQLGISIDFFDSRFGKGDARQYVLSSIYQGKLFQGTWVDRADSFGQGNVTLKNGRSRLYQGSFKLEQRSEGNGYVMSLDGKITGDPGDGRKFYPVKTTLPCVDLSA